MVYFQHRAGSSRHNFVLLRQGMETVYSLPHLVCSFIFYLPGLHAVCPGTIFILVE